MTLHLGDCLDVLPTLDAESIDAIVTDPPYGLAFMGKEWDKLSAVPERDDRWSENWGGYGWHGGKPIPGMDQQASHYRWAVEAFRVAKPGAHLLAFGGTRTYHRLASAIEDAGWEIRDTLVWAYASGFPKSLDVSKAIDKAAGVEREVTGPHATNTCPGGEWCRCETDGRSFSPTKHAPATAPATDAAREWQGWGTALKPAWEPIVLARKPLRGTVAANVQAYGTGALNIDGTRLPVAADDPVNGAVWTDRSGVLDGQQPGRMMPNPDGTRRALSTGITGRWPANVILTDPIFDGDTPGVVGGGETAPPKPERVGLRGGTAWHGMDGFGSPDQEGRWPADPGGTYSRFFLVPKSSRSDREPVLGGLPLTKGGSMSGVETRPDRPTNHPMRANVHPTVKPTDLMRHLVRLVTPPRVPCLRCSACGTVVEYGHAVQQTITKPPAPELPRVRDGVRGGSSEPGVVLLQDVREPGDSSEPSIDEGLRPLTEGLHPGVPTGASDGTSERVPPPASTRDGGTDGAPADAGRDRGSHQRDQGRQPAGELAPADETGARQPAQTSEEADRVPELSLDDRDHGSCPACGASLSPDVRIGLVLDPFMGSGSTALACEMEGFRWVGIEREAEYVAIAEARLNGTQRGLGLVG